MIVIPSYSQLALRTFATDFTVKIINRSDQKNAALYGKVWDRLSVMIRRKAEMTQNGAIKIQIFETWYRFVTEIQAMATSKNSPRRRHNYLTHVILVLSHDLCTEMQIVQTNHWCAASSGTYRIRKLKFVSAVSKKLFLLIATSFSYFIASLPLFETKNT